MIYWGLIGIYGNIYMEKTLDSLGEKRHSFYWVRAQIKWNRSCICLSLACFPPLIVADIITNLCETVLNPQKLRASEWLSPAKRVQNVRWRIPRYTRKLEILWENKIFLMSAENKDTHLWICIFPHTALAADYTNIR